MDEPLSTSDVFKKLGIGGNGVNTEIDEHSTAENPKFEGNQDSIEHTNDGPEPSATQQPANSFSDNQSNSPIETATNQDEVSSHLLPPEDYNSQECILTAMEQLQRDVNTIAGMSSRTLQELKVMHKLYHNEFASRLVSMQTEIEHYQEIDKGRIFDDILREIAKLYSENESIVDEVPDEKLKKRIRYMFLDILQILETYGVTRLSSNPGEKRNTRHCQVVERLSTDNSELHDTVIRSRNSGFFIDKRTLVKELVDIYLYTNKSNGNTSEY